MGATKVVYWEVNKGQPAKRVTDICFRPLGGLVRYDFEKRMSVTSPLPELIRYAAPIKDRMGVKMVRWYADFLLQAFGPTFRYRLPRTGRRVIWELPIGSLTRAGALTYLTAFRYVDELPILIRELYAVYEKSPDKTTDELLLDWARIHHSHSVRSSLNLFGHGLMASKECGVTVEQLRSNLANKTLGTVQGHFVPPKPPAVMPPSPLVVLVPPAPEKA